MTKRVILDTNMFILCIIGNLDINKISNHKTTSINNKDHYYFLLELLSKYNELIICPNIATEVDNLLNNFSGKLRQEYLELSRAIFKNSIEVYIETISILDSYHYKIVGITDAVLIEMAKNCDLLISGDSKLCDFAKSLNCNVFDFKQYVNYTTY